MIVKVEPIIHKEIMNLCQRPYPNHPKGCPNFGRKEGCPPNMPFFDAEYDVGQDVYAIVTEFDLREHADRMKAKHPEWSDRQCRNILFWQGRAKKHLRVESERFAAARPGYEVVQSPEKMGVNVTRTLRNAGVILEWPPRNTVRLVAMAAIPRTDGDVGKPGQADK